MTILHKRSEHNKVYFKEHAKYKHLQLTSLRVDVAVPHPLHVLGWC